MDVNRERQCYRRMASRPLHCAAKRKGSGRGSLWSQEGLGLAADSAVSSRTRVGCRLGNDFRGRGVPNLGMEPEGTRVGADGDSE